MNARQFRKLAAYQTTEAVLTSHPAAARLPGLPTLLTAFQARLAELHELGQTQSEPMRLSTARRDAIFEAMGGMALEIAGVVRIVANLTGRRELAGAVAVTPSSFDRGPHCARVWRAQAVLETARSVEAELAPFGVTADTLATLHARIEAAHEGIGITRHAKVRKRGATEHLRRVFAEADALLVDGIDRLVFFVRTSDPAFYIAYHATRRTLRRRRARREAESAPASAERDLPAAA